MKADFDIERQGTGTREWAEVTENIQRGCANGCLYCYAAHNAARFHLRFRPEWEREELTPRAEVRSYPARDGVVMFPSAHDITPFNVEAYIRVARLILEKGNRLLIVSKPRRECINRVMDALETWREQICFRFTIGALDNRLLALWEPGAPEWLDRLDSLADAEARGFARSVSIEPMLAGVEATLDVVENVLPWGPETVWIGKMNKIRLRVADPSPEIVAAIERVERQQRDEEILRLYGELKDLPLIRWKDSIKIVLAKHGIGVEA
jgi:DNA repair photolyase